MIAEEILEAVAQPLREQVVKDVVIGLGYTAVQLDDGHCGLAATPRDEITACCSLINRAGELTGGPASDLAQLLMSTGALESAVGLATVNAGMNRDVEGNAPPLIDALEIGKRDVVGMVGRIEPLIEPIQEQCDKLHVFERKPSDSEFVHPDWAATLLLSQCDVVLISATTLINKTLDALLGFCRGRVAVVGPSTPLSPILAQHGVSFVFGVVVRDTAKALEIVSQAGGARSFGNAVEKINLRL
jgi:uncharacterized protein (DUF4213/DUF364 family)